MRKQTHTATPRAKVLVVDDEPMLLEAIADYLEGAGFAVATSSSALALPLLAREEAPDLILLDITMPGLLGDRAVRAMRRGACADRVPILLHSGLDEEELRERARGSGADGYVPKHAGPRLLLAEVERWVSAGLEPAATELPLEG